MMNRMLLALGVALALVGPAFAQEPPEELSQPRPVVPESQPVVPESQPNVLEEPVTPLDACVTTGTVVGNRSQFWATGDYLLSCVRGTTLPSLVTTAPAGTARAAAGILGPPSTTVLFGGVVNNDLRSGFRMGTGFWFTPEQALGVEAGFTIIESQATGFTASSDGNTILARPFTDPNTNSQQAQLVAFPGSSSGSIAARSSSNNFYEAHFDLTEKVIDTGRVRLESLLGYRFYRYDEGLRVRQQINPTNPNFVPGTTIVTNDDFGTHNEFHGLDMGLRAKFSWDNVALGLLAKVAVGHVNREQTINGNSTTTVPGVAPVTANGGFLAGSSNGGFRTNGDWAAMPELGVNVSWQVNPNLRLRLGYSVLWLDRVGRAADQVSTTINPNLFPGAVNAGVGPSNPAFEFIRSDVWIQSVNVGVEFTF